MPPSSSLSENAAPGGYPQVSPSVRLRRVEGGPCFASLATGRVVALDPLQMEILELCSGERSAAEIAGQTGVSNLGDFLDAMERDGLVETFPAPRPGKVEVNRSNPPHLYDLGVEVTGRCNLRCRHCYNDDWSQAEQAAAEMSTGEIKDLIDQADAMNVLYLQFSGGEPLMREDIFELLAHAQARHLPVRGFFTNGLRLDGDAIRQLKQHGVRSVMLSLDGPDAASHEALRGSGALAPVWRAMERMIGEPMWTVVDTMVTRHNLHRLPEMLAQLNRPNLIWRLGLPMQAGRYVQSLPELGVEFVPGLEALLDLARDYLELREAGKALLHLEVGDVFNHRLWESGPLAQAGLGQGGPCAYSQDMLITPQGEVHYCMPMYQQSPQVSRVGSLREQTLAELWQKRQGHPLARLEMEELAGCAGCGWVELCRGGCRAGALKSGGGLTDPDPYSCHSLARSRAKLLPALPLERREELERLTGSQGPPPYSLDRIRYY